MQKRVRKTTLKEQLFCDLYVQTRNPKEAALRAGFSKNPEMTAHRLFKKPEITREIAALSQKRQSDEAAVGFRRLAFGNTADALKLCFAGPDGPPDADKMDLFNISEIKVKGDLVEIKFFDRQKALERLCDLTAAEKGNPQTFFEALEKGAATLYEV